MESGNISAELKALVDALTITQSGNYSAGMVLGWLSDSLEITLKPPKLPQLPSSSMTYARRSLTRSVISTLSVVSVYLDPNSFHCR